MENAFFALAARMRNIRRWGLMRNSYEIDRAVRRKSGAGAFGGDGAVSFEIPVYAGEPFVEVNGGVPFFREEELTAEPFKSFSPLDPLGRCGPAMCCLGRESMPLEARGEIGTVRPSGWHTARYDDLIEDKYLYNRCHLIAYMLSGENDNALNLITGDMPTPVKYMNEDIRRSYKAVERGAEEQLLQLLPGEMRPAYGELLRGGEGETHDLVKAADKLAAYVKCIEELRAGNQEFRSAEEQIREALAASPLPEVPYFMEHFLPAFGMTLDELTRD